MINKIFFILCITFLLHNTAQAKGFFIINTGDEMFPVAAFPQEIIEQDEDFKNFQVGYKCSHFGILWADFRIWDCSLVGINPSEKDTYYELPEVVTEYLKSKPEFQEDKMQRNFWNKFGMYILILIIVGYFFTRFRKSSSSE
ncbi:hypothetical protein [Acinetobacter equi]|uniref:Uncharacterized protein n=1 Tax=Acinetobacter equi TaxID=1324350 RepID=A0A0N9WCY3_9GAMM|nr:hypothetical protein [Acinetobacter equi]ALH95201.1 hypothetical protein AOY20_06420 [Acinetobacter equi]